MNQRLNGFAPGAIDLSHVQQQQAMIQQQADDVCMGAAIAVFGHLVSAEIIKHKAAGTKMPAADVRQCAAEARQVAPFFGEAVGLIQFNPAPANPPQADAPAKE